MDMSRSL